MVITFINEGGGGLVSKTVLHGNEYPRVSVQGLLVNTVKLRLAGFLVYNYHPEVRFSSRYTRPQALSV